MDGKYRKFIDENAVVAEQKDIVEQTDLLLLEDVKRMKDDIESRVGEIADMLGKISGLSEIDEIKEKVSELSKDLY